MRSDDDQWGITESVGVTALGVASGRALETHRDDGLVDDPHAEAFADAASDEIALPTCAEEGDDFTAQSAYIGVRSRFFDELAARYGRPLDPGMRDVFGKVRLLDATRTG